MRNLRKTTAIDMEFLEICPILSRRLCYRKGFYDVIDRNLLDIYLNLGVVFHVWNSDTIPMFNWDIASSELGVYCSLRRTTWGLHVVNLKAS